MDYRIDDLARVAGTTVRNVRVYQDRELLPPPRKEGRTAIYSDAHLTRLKLIISMLDRGYAFAQIKEMIAAWESGRSLGEVLGLEEAVQQRSWAHDPPRTISDEDLSRDFGDQVTGQVIDRVLELGVVERRGRRLVAPHPELYDAAADLVDLGVPLVEVLDIAENMIVKVDALGEQLAGLVSQHILPQVQTAQETTAFYGDVIDRLRTVVFKALTSAAIRSADHRIPAVVADRLAELMSDSEHPRSTASS